jgi:hypothetical protein
LEFLPNKYNFMHYFYWRMLTPNPPPPPPPTQNWFCSYCWKEFVKSLNNSFFHTVPNNFSDKMANDYISFRFSNTLLYWGLHRVYFISHFAPPSDAFTAVTGTPQKCTTVSYALHYKQVQEDFSLLLLFYTGYSHSSLLTFTSNGFTLPSTGHHLLCVQFTTCIKWNLSTALTRKNTRDNNSINWHTQDTRLDYISHWS